MSNARGGWELSKENIQPLSCGRRMADLADALPTRTATVLSDQQQYEEHHLRETEKLEQLAKQNTGDDPLQNWLNLIKYFQQHFPNMSHAIRAKYSLLMRQTLKEFYTDVKYANDERYIRLAIVNVRGLPPVQQIKCLSDFLRDGTGQTVSEMYIRLAELFVGEGDIKNASDLLKRGIQNNAQPRSKLEEMLTHIQEVWAKNFAKSLKTNASNSAEQCSQPGDRNFASSVPISGENNEAITIRRNLQPAAPANTSKATTNIRQSTLSQKLSVFNEENMSPQSALSNENPVEKRDPKRLDMLENVESDRENKLEAGRWNLKHTQLENPVIPEPPQKLKLYQEESDKLPSSSSIDKSKTINKRALRDKKEESELSEASIVSSFQPAAFIGNEKVAETSFKEKKLDFQPATKERESTAVNAFILHRNYCANLGRDNFFENIKYKPLPPGRVVSRVMLKCEKYFEERGKEMKKRELANNAEMKLRNEIEALANKNKNLLVEVEHLKATLHTTKDLEKRLEEQKQHFELKLFERDQKICSLESQNEDLMSQLTRMTTNNNVRESQFERAQYEKQQLQQGMEQLHKKFEEEKQLLVQELEFCKRQNEIFSQAHQQPFIKQIKQETLSDEEAENEVSTNIGKKKSFVDIHVSSRTAEICSSSSTDQGTDEVSRFHSGDTTVEHQQSITASSFMPNLSTTAGEKSMFTNSATLPRRALGMVERPLESDMMNMTPATAPPIDFEDFPAPSLGPELFKVNKRGFELYESFYNSSSTTSKPTWGGFNVAGTGNKRVDIVKCLQNLPENMPPPPVAQTAVVAPKLTFDENSQFLRSDVPAVNFRIPAPPSDENAMPTTLPKPRRSILLARRQSSSSDEEEDIILRRHQQTGVDLNISNLTTLLALGPKPLINSTPEREKTFRDLPPIAPRTLVQHENTDEPPVSESHAIRASRFSILNEPPLNLSTIQETSRENRSRSTTGSSSGNTMSSTRFGTVSGSTQLYGNMTSRSSSVPRSASRISQQNNNGYYSDTNAMQ